MSVYMVVMDGGGLFGIYDSYKTATSVAESIEGVVIALPILVDFRTRKNDVAEWEKPVAQYQNPVVWRQ